MVEVGYHEKQLFIDFLYSKKSCVYGRGMWSDGDVWSTSAGAWSEEGFMECVSSFPSLLRVPGIELSLSGCFQVALYFGASGVSRD